MAKRLRDTRIWDREWFQRLPPRLKNLWDYLCDHCDHAGFWSENYQIATLKIGEPVRREDLAVFGSRIVRIDSDKIWIKRFVEFQYSVGLGARERKLNPKNNAHIGVIRALEANGIDSTPWIEFVHPNLDVIHKPPHRSAPTEPQLSPTGIRNGNGIGTEEGGSGGETSQTLNAEDANAPDSLARAIAQADPEKAGLIRKWFRSWKPAPGGAHV